MEGSALYIDDVALRTSLIENGSFESFDVSTNGPDNWEIVDGDGPALVALTDHAWTYGVGGTRSLKIGGGSENSSGGAKAIAVDDGKTYTITARVRTTATDTGGFYLRMNESNTDLGGKEYVGETANSYRAARSSFKDVNGIYDGSEGNV